MFNYQIFRLKSLAAYVIEKRDASSSDIPDELLYGRAGYLSGLLYINANISPPPIEPDIITQVYCLKREKEISLICL